MKKLFVTLTIAAFFPLAAFADSVSLTIRDGATVLYTGSVTLPDANAAAVSVFPTASTTSYSVPARSVTAVLSELDAQESSFSLSQLIYYPSFGSFYIRCITGTTELCDSWQYYVNGSAPAQGTDATLLQDGDVMYVYFGTPSRVSLSNATPNEGDVFYATAESYNPVTNTYTPRPNVTIGITQDPFAFPVVTATTSFASSTGGAAFYMNTSGRYTVGVAEDGYFPTTNLEVRAHGAIPVTVRVETATTTLFKNSVDIPACVTPINERKTMNGYCSFAAAGIAVDQSWSSFGAFVTSISNQVAAPSYWTLFINKEPAMTGIDGYLPQNADEVLWVLDTAPIKLTSASSSLSVGATTTLLALGFDFNSFSYMPLSGALIEGLGTTTAADGTVMLTATSSSSLMLSASKSGYLASDTLRITVGSSTITTPTTPPSSGGGSVPKPAFNQSHALGFLGSKQKSDGSFGAQLFTDWASIAIASQGTNEARSKLKTYQETSILQTPTLTDYERHAMALMALGINPYSVKGNVIASIAAGFDGTQFGDTSLVNDDIFAIIPLLKAGYTQDDSIISKAALFIISKQRPDGSWEGSADLTGAAIQAIGSLYKVPGVNSALGRASGYLAKTQQPDGGWSSIDATSWIKSALNAINEAHPTPEFVSSAGNSVSDALGSAQQNDGGVRIVTDSMDNRVWSTSYALAAASGKSWSTIMQSFPKPAAGGGGSIVSTESTTTVATSTPIIPTASSTPATSTPPSVTLFALTSSATASTTAPITPTTQPKKKSSAKRALPKATSTPPASVATSTQPAAAALQTNIFIRLISFFASLLPF